MSTRNRSIQEEGPNVDDDDNNNIVWTENENDDIFSRVYDVIVFISLNLSLGLVHRKTAVYDI